jgi:hypothetical protein
MEGLDISIVAPSETEQFLGGRLHGVLVTSLLATVHPQIVLGGDASVLGDLEEDAMGNILFASSQTSDLSGRWNGLFVVRCAQLADDDLGVGCGCRGKVVSKTVETHQFVGFDFTLEDALEVLIPRVIIGILALKVITAESTLAGIEGTDARSHPAGPINGKGRGRWRDLELEGDLAFLSVFVHETQARFL